MGAQLYTEREEQERLAIYEEAKRKAKLRYANFIDKEEQRRMIAEMELMLMDKKNHYSRHMLEVEMKSLTDKFLDK
jgi:hypothetical protein